MVPLMHGLTLEVYLLGLLVVGDPKTSLAVLHRIVRRLFICLVRVSFDDAPVPSAGLSNAQLR
jgi:hypothetical protein